MDRDSFYSRYADLILNSALKIKSGDVLSINTEEEDYEFARFLAREAKAVTGNGSYIQLLKDGRIVSSFDILSPFPLTRNPNIFIYLSYYKDKGSLDGDAVYEAKDLMRFGLLSDPLSNPLPSFPFVKVYLPSKEWDEKTFDNDLPLSSEEVIRNILNLDYEDYIGYNEMINQNILFKTKILNSLSLLGGKITDDSGTDLEFKFLPSSEFISSYSVTTEERLFSPTLVSREIYRLIDPASLTGWLNTTMPFLLFGERVSGLSFYFENGKVTKVMGGKREEELFRIYSSQDSEAVRASMLTLNELDDTVSSVDLTHIREYDAMRSVSITIGGPKGEAQLNIDEDKTVDSLVSLSLPIGSMSLVITAFDKDDEEWTIYEDGTIQDSFLVE